MTLRLRCFEYNQILDFGQIIPGRQNFTTQIVSSGKVFIIPIKSVNLKATRLKVIEENIVKFGRGKNINGYD